jgi:secreted PhoX family phosphatase
MGQGFVKLHEQPDGVNTAAKRFIHEIALVRRSSHWPNGPTGGRSRSATVVIRRKNGGVVGT